MPADWPIGYGVANARRRPRVTEAVITVCDGSTWSVRVRTAAAEPAASPVIDPAEAAPRFDLLGIESHTGLLGESWLLRVGLLAKGLRGGRVALGCGTWRCVRRVDSRTPRV